MDLGTIGVGNSPYGVAISPDGSRAYVTNAPYASYGSVSVIRRRWWGLAPM